MVKFSIIVPVYNVEQYLAGCLDSILNQTYNDFEVIVVNDGATDNSQSIIDEYVKKDRRVKGFKKKNGGLSDARNFGVGKAKGEYLLFVDSDDNINNELLEKLDEEIENSHPDIIRFQMAKIDEETHIVLCPTFSGIRGAEAFRLLANDDYFVTACSCCYRKEFWDDNNFKYTLGVYHEDYGLTPYVYIKAKKASVIDYVGYNYYFRENSIMNDKNLEKEVKKNKDVLDLFDSNIKIINNDKKVDYEDKKLFRSYMANGLITKCASLDDELFNEFFLELKKRDLGQYLITDSLGRMIKKLVYKLMPKFYIKHFK